MRKLMIVVIRFALLCSSLFAGTIAPVTIYGQSSASIHFFQGDIFVGAPLGTIYHYSDQGNHLDTLNTGEQSGSSVTGMCFDKEGSLYAVNFNANTISEFNSSGQLVKYPWGGPFYPPWISNCVVDSSGNIYVSEYYFYSGDEAIEKFAPDGTLLSTYNPASQEYTAHQIWIDLAPDNCTIYYTNNGTTIKRFNICTNSQQNDFITGPPGTGYDAVHVRPNGEVFATLAGEVIRFSATGNILTTYSFPDTNESNAIVGFDFDIDNTHFWAGALRTGNVFKVNIETGTVAILNMTFFS